jgi:hypothetical protein
MMVLNGEFGDETPDCAIFADTGWEPPSVYDWLNYLKNRAFIQRFPVYIVQSQLGSIRDHIIAAVEGKRKWFVSVPFFVHSSRKEGLEQRMMRRQCTERFKIRVIRRKIRELLKQHGLKQAKNAVEMWIGISTDEFLRMKQADVRYIKHRWPLIERKMSRTDCLNWFADLGWPSPPRSSCIGCPYHDDMYWADMKKNYPEDWHDAVQFDTAIRSTPQLAGANAYLHRSLKPLNEVELKPKKKANNFINECEGMCGL